MTKTHLYVVVMKGAGPRLKQDSGPRQDTQLFVLAYFKVSCKCLDVLFLSSQTVTALRSHTSCKGSVQCSHSLYVLYEQSEEDGGGVQSSYFNLFLQLPLGNLMKTMHNERWTEEVNYMVPYLHFQEQHRLLLKNSGSNFND